MTNELNTSEFKPIEWTDAMSTGIAAVDAQHRFLVDTLRGASEALLPNPETSRLAEVARDLLGYALVHFETEEKLMAKYGYTEARRWRAAAHIAQHRHFSRQVVEVLDALREGRSVTSLDVLRFLNDWLRDHVLGIDQELAAFIAASPAFQAEEGVTGRSK